MERAPNLPAGERVRLEEPQPLDRFVNPSLLS